MRSRLSMQHLHRRFSLIATLGSFVALLPVAELQANGAPTGASSGVQTMPLEYQQAAPETEWGLNPEYLLYLPAGYEDSEESSEPWPILFFLHGAGHRGDSLNTIKKLAPLAQVVDGKRSFPFLVAAPQCPKDGRWRDPGTLEELMTFVREVVAKYNIDEKRVYLSGQSMGGTGTWALLHSNPDYFAAGIPICGGNKPEWGEALTDMPIWAFHGRLDEVVVPAYSIDIVNRIRESGGTQVKLTIYEDVKHQSWWRAFKEPELYEWMLGQSR